MVARTIRREKMKKLLSVLGIAVFLSVYLLSSSVYAAKQKPGPETKEGTEEANKRLPGEGDSGSKPISSNEGLASNADIGGKNYSTTKVFAIPVDAVLAEDYDVVAKIGEVAGADVAVVIVSHKGEELKLGTALEKLKLAGLNIDLYTAALENTAANRIEELFNKERLEGSTLDNMDAGLISAIQGGV